MTFRKATKEQAKLKMALVGPSGSGKTKTALKIATHLVPSGKIALIDTEHGSASLYSDEFDFDVQELVSFAPDNYIKAIHEAQGAGYDVLIIDSLSHAWMGKDGVLEFKDKQGSDFNAWRKASPLHDRLVDALLSANLHLIVTMRSKMAYTMEEYEDNGRKKTRVTKIGLQPQQRDGLEYEFSIVADIDIEHIFRASKSRCDALTDLAFPKAGKDVADILSNWLNSGAVPQPKPQAAQQPEQPTTRPPANGQADLLPDHPAEMALWFRGAVNAMQPLPWSDETRLDNAQALAITLKKHGLGDTKRQMVYEILAGTGKTSGKDLDARELFVLQQNASPAGVQKLLAMLAWHQAQS